MHTHTLLLYRTTFSFHPHAQHSRFKPGSRTCYIVRPVFKGIFYTGVTPQLALTGHNAGDMVLTGQCGPAVDGQRVVLQSLMELLPFLEQQTPRGKEDSVREIFNLSPLRDRWAAETAGLNNQHLMLQRLRNAFNKQVRSAKPS